MVSFKGFQLSPRLTQELHQILRVGGFLLDLRSGQVAVIHAQQPPPPLESLATPRPRARARQWSGHNVLVPRARSSVEHSIRPRGHDWNLGPEAPEPFELGLASLKFGLPLSLILGLGLHQKSPAFHHRLAPSLHFSLLLEPDPLLLSLQLPGNRLLFRHPPEVVSLCLPQPHHLAQSSEILAEALQLQCCSPLPLLPDLH
mmetsp:Transcript_19800/g.31013  ORF Transcript_19800/g.31013 Transcript_19800/m.31013 type:complete len:201 (+) Transcript_19800:432-1034(+)